MISSGWQVTNYLVSYASVHTETRIGSWVLDVATKPAAADLNVLVAEAAKDLADYQRLTAESKLGKAGQKLEQLKRTLDELSERQK